MWLIFGCPCLRQWWIFSKTALITEQHTDKARNFPGAANRVSLSRAQLDALVLGLPWSRIGEGGIISVAG